MRGGLAIVLTIRILLANGQSLEVSPICETPNLSDSSVLEDAGQEVSFEFSCTNWMWEKYETKMEVLVALDPLLNLKICVDGGDESCVPEADTLKLNMTKKQQNYTVRLLAEEEGIFCLKLSSVYMAGNTLYDPKAAELLVTNSTDEELERGTAVVEDIPDVYTHIFEVEVDAEPSRSGLGDQRKNKSEERSGRDFEAEEVVMANASLIEGSYKDLLKDKGPLWEEVNVFTREIRNTLMDRGSHFSRILLLLGLASAGVSILRYFRRNLLRENSYFELIL